MKRLQRGMKRYNTGTGQAYQLMHCSAMSMSVRSMSRRHSTLRVPELLVASEAVTRGSRSMIVFRARAASTAISALPPQRSSTRSTASSEEEMRMFWPPRSNSWFSSCMHISSRPWSSNWDSPSITARMLEAEAPS